MNFDKVKLDVLNCFQKKFNDFFEERKRRIYMRRFNESREAWHRRQIERMNEEMD